jgi:uncharacterized membrane protein
MKRVQSIDLMRGFVMVFMALDHVRDLMHINSVTESPTNLSTTTPILFFTRWITYLCAPTFVFLAGSSAYLSFTRQKNIRESRKFLIRRGLWLILLEFTLVNFAIWFDFGFHNFIFEVIATIGFGFIILGILAKASIRTIFLIGIGIVFLHNLFPFIPFEKGSLVNAALSPFFEPGGFSISSRTNFTIAYPPIPWLGIMLLGFAGGKLFELPDFKRKKLFFNIGLGALLLFIILRFIDIYGDPSPWATQKNPVYTFLSFMNITKYPPSLLFCLVTLGLMFLLLGFAENLKTNFFSWLSVYGRVPLFYFIVHFYLIHALMLVLMFSQGFHWSALDFASGRFGRPKDLKSGIPLWAVYLVWIAVVGILYKPCRWYGKYKAAHGQWWLKFF